MRALTLSIFVFGMFFLPQVSWSQEQAGTGDQWSALAGEWICYRGRGYAIKRITPQKEIYELYWRDGSQQETYTHKLQLSEEHNTNVFTKLADDGSIAFKGIYKIHQDRFFEIGNTFKNNNKSKPNVLEYRRTDSAIEKWLAAARTGDIETLKTMLQDGMDVDATASNSLTALGFASASGQLDTIRFLLSKDADLTKKTLWFGTLPIIEAAAFGKTDACKVLLEAGAKLDQTHNFRMTPLHETAYHAHVETMRFLIAKGADLNSKNFAGATPLHIAVFRCVDADGQLRQDSVKAIDLLIQSGADCDAQNKQGETAQQIAEKRSIGPVVELFEKRKN